MGQAKWIWNQDDFELHHYMLLSNRRANRSYKDNGSNVYSAKNCIPHFHQSIWKLDRPTCKISVFKNAEIKEPETVTFHANTEYSVMFVDGVPYNRETSARLEAGEHKIQIYAFTENGFPSVMVEGNVFASDETWTASNDRNEYSPAGTNDMYNSPDDDPRVFKFKYERLEPVSVEKINDGTLYDFGMETFARLTFFDVEPKNMKLLVIPGESREEALDCRESLLVLNADVKEGRAVVSPCAFRYLFIPDFEGKYDFTAEYEYLDIKDKGEFTCDNELINQIWKISARTLHLNSREGFMDGIKRDRWVWSGDAYQSYIVNYYLMNDNDIVRRTARMLRGADEMNYHINTIPDYTFLWIMSIWEYYFQSGDRSFVQSIYPKMKSAIEFTESRLTPEGLYTPEYRDWVFVDWAKFDKDKGPMSSEQLLLSRAYKSMSFVADALGFNSDREEYSAKADRLQQLVNERYWDEEKGAFVDDYTSGNRNVTRHANIIALLFDMTSEERKQSIIDNVIKNTEIQPILTPYFEFFELDAMLRIGETKFFTDMLESYWGGMIKLGATSIWEQFDPTQSGIQHYWMYGSKYGKSLCHAWGSSPIYLLGRYALGVRTTSVGGKTFEVKPNKLCYGFIKGKVPLATGIVEVEMNNECVSVLADADGGTLILGDRRYTIEKNVKLTVKL